MTDSAKLPALAVTDRWMRGVIYSRTFQLLEADGTAIDFGEQTTSSTAAWSSFYGRISGSSGEAQDVVVRTQASTESSGYLSVAALASSLELDWPQRGLGPRNLLLVSIYGIRKQVQVPLMQMRLTVEDSALA